VKPLETVCVRCTERPAIVFLNDDALCEPCAHDAFLACDTGVGLVVDIHAPRVIDVRPAASRPTFSNRAQGGVYGFGACSRFHAGEVDAVVLLDDEPLCLEHYSAELAATRARLFPLEAS
jgi:hypothetical protein